jgi:hypothetical protein
MWKLLEIIWKVMKGAPKRAPAPKVPPKPPVKPGAAKKKADEGGDATKARKVACKGCKRPNRRHDPCKAKGGDPSKDANSMVDPDVADTVSQELDDVIAGNLPKTGEFWTAASGRRYGAHGDALFPVDGPGITNFDRLQHQYNVRLNTVGYEQANYELERRGNLLSAEKKKQVEEMWKKCKK